MKGLTFDNIVVIKEKTSDAKRNKVTLNWVLGHEGEKRIRSLTWRKASGLRQFKMFICPYAKGWSALIGRSKDNIQLAKLMNADCVEKQRNQQNIHIAELSCHMQNQENIPRRAYNISVQTVSEDETSTPTTAQYRTIPLRPLTLNYDKSSVTHNSFKVHWEPPKGVSEFDKYQVVINVRRQGTAAPITRNRDEMTEWEFKENLEPGRTYHVLVKTVSGKVTSWPAAVNVTVKPLPVVNLRASVNDATGAVILSWQPDNSSFQEEYKFRKINFVKSWSYQESMFGQYYFKSHFVSRGFIENLKIAFGSEAPCRVTVFSGVWSSGMAAFCN
ncbi:hypothetical protein J6590_034535 [Homalodisca vitripennis]|nr:hypothetical protein J6590_034535 [Homalodisca vitripennis]